MLDILLSHRKALISLCGVVFDMDGTLTVPLDKTKRIRAQFDIPETVEIFSFIKTLPNQERIRAYSFVHELETECIPKMKLKPKVTELLTFLHMNKVGLVAFLLLSLD